MSNAYEPKNNIDEMLQAILDDVDADMSDYLTQNMVHLHKCFITQLEIFSSRIPFCVRDGEKAIDYELWNYATEERFIFVADLIKNWHDDLYLFLSHVSNMQMCFSEELDEDIEEAKREILEYSEVEDVIYVKIDDTSSTGDGAVSVNNARQWDDVVSQAGHRMIALKSSIHKRLVDFSISFKNKVDEFHEKHLAQIDHLVKYSNE